MKSLMTDADDAYDAHDEYGVDAHDDDDFDHQSR